MSPEPSRAAAADPAHGDQSHATLGTTVEFRRSGSFEPLTDIVGGGPFQLAGAYYGESGIPARWREKLAKLSVIESFADRLADMHPA